MKGLMIVAILGLALWVACDEEIDESAPTPTQPASTMEGATVTTQEALPTFPPQSRPTLDPPIPFEEYRSADKGYTIGYPQGTQPTDPISPDTDEFLYRVGGVDVLRISVGCRKGTLPNGDPLTPRGMLMNDAAILGSRAEINVADAQPITVAGTEGLSIEYATSLGSARAEQKAAYVVIGECGWRIALISYGAGTLSAHLPIFERMINSFRPD